MSAAAAAERLDLSQENHNRIATALALLQSGDESPFAQAAIEDGREQLAHLYDAKPHVATTALRWPRLIGMASLALLIGLLAFLIVPPAPTGGVDPSSTQDLRAELPPDALRLPGESELTDVPERSVESEAAKPRTTTPKTPKPGTKSTPEEESPDHERSESKAAGPMGEEASGRSQAGRASSDSRSAASGASAESEPSDKEPPKPRKPRAPKAQKPNEPKPADTEKNTKKAGSIAARGSSGSGSMRTVQNDWSSKVKAKSDEQDDADSEESEDEEMDPDKQRMGAQPSLKNRSAKISRQLSLFMGRDKKNTQKRGRGGGAPGTAKKSRGTATMIMGVPVPGFVQGRLKEGPSKSTQEDVQPSPRQGDYATPIPLGETKPEEAGQERFSPPAVLGVRARDYLIQYHKTYGNDGNDNVTDR